ncbi:MAG: hypothetical protein E4G98_07285 [Promethearchaeota archaeon]|nr:MAG: hypothetical protein E4G98_07285 [Candidatus Lokiarchaeota archaeon]
MFSSLALDSNVFRNYDFINYLSLNAQDFEIYLPTVVQLEVGYFYRTKGENWDFFLKDLEKFGCKLMQWGMFKNSIVIENAFMHRKELPFQHHFRDYIIGTECENEVEMLISYNIKHFIWVKKVKIVTPEELVKLHQEYLQG